MITIQGIRSNDFLPLGIQLAMWKKAIFRGLKPIHCPNHFSVTVGGKEYEAVWPDVIKRDYDINHHQYVIEWKIDVPKEVEDRIQAKLDAIVGMPYEWENILFHLIDVYTGWYPGKERYDRWSCVKVVNMVLIELGYDVNINDDNYYTTLRLNKEFGQGKVIKDKEAGFWKTFMRYSPVLMWIFAIVLVIVLLCNHTLFKDIIIRSYF